MSTSVSFCMAKICIHIRSILYMRVYVRLQHGTRSLIKRSSTALYVTTSKSRLTVLLLPYRKTAKKYISPVNGRMQISISVHEMPLSDLRRAKNSFISD